MTDSIRVFAPGSVSNVGCGFDTMGFALEAPGDTVILRKRQRPGLSLLNSTPYEQIPLDPEQNTAGAAILSLLRRTKSDQGFELTFEKKIRPGSGVGSSAASAAAAVFAANELLGRPLSKPELVEPGMDGETLASKARHADNVAPTLLGGFILIRGYEPIADLVQLTYPDMFCVVIHPHIEVKTAESRGLLPADIPLTTAIAQWGNVGGLVAGLAQSDFGLIGRAIQDRVAEPARKCLIPGYDEAKQAALDAGAVGFNISGSGPSVFALTRTQAEAQKVCAAIERAFGRHDVVHDCYLSAVNRNGTITLD